MDVKLLMIFDDLYHTRSVTQTAENFRTNQPSISMSLAKLRRHFNDPLFVRTRSGMEPTPHAREIARLLSKANELVPSRARASHGVRSIDRGADVSSHLDRCWSGGDLANIFRRSGQIRVVELPFKLPTYPVMQFWHERFDRDAGSRWLRRLIAELFHE